MTHPILTEAQLLEIESDGCLNPKCPCSERRLINSHRALSEKLKVAEEALELIAWFKGGRPAPVNLAREALAKIRGGGA